MRVEATAVTISWIPSESLSGALRSTMDLGVTHWDDPPPDVLEGADAVAALQAGDRFRFANVLAAWAEFDGDRLVDAGVGDGSGVRMGSTTVRLGPLGATFRAAALPTLRRDPERGDGEVAFVQTVGGRTGAPLPRRVPHPPFVRWQAPLVWTTLRLVLRADGSSTVDLIGASAFPRHWAYDATGRMVQKSGLADQAEWLDHSFGPRTPWGEADREPLAMAGESDLERLLSARIMRGGRRPEIRELPVGAALTRQGEPGDELFLLLDGVVRVEVAGHGVLAELGPGAVVGERALLEGGTRTATLTTVTPLRVAVARADAVDLDHLRELAEGRRREEAAPA